MLPLSDVAAGRGDDIPDETCVVFSVEFPPLICKLSALPLYISFVVSSNMLASLKLCLVCVSRLLVWFTAAPVLVKSGKVMASRLARLNLSLACHSAPPLV